MYRLYSDTMKRRDFLGATALIAAVLGLRTQLRMDRHLEQLEHEATDITYPDRETFMECGALTKMARE